jgi:cyanosortase A-associated protein
MKESLRGYLLATTLGATLLVLGKVVLFPNNPRARIPTYELPEQVPLAGWQSTQNHTLGAQRQRGPALVSSVDEAAIAARYYEYVRNNTPLGIEMRYFVESYNHVPAIIQDSTILFKRNGLRDRTRPEVGSYVLYINQGKIYLSACLDAQGKASVYDTEMVFNQNRPSAIARRIAPWILKQAPLRDLRCLWVNLSMDTQRFNPDEVDTKLLETTFVDLARWWQQNYPKE